ncbi:MAG: DivIVA domain-containing protein [Syntrophomonadaceae bacterium]|jgi:cell division initiation protein|nr:DivIVA domain-containing protein [Bacillota bacterium]NLM87868.1 DivIVA domain-containing protein [Syntrophomonadaceae bacterium]HAA08142.1 cell division protein [Syntrophomonas sp.]HQA49578.1 DivIVA domain-containing protein [Syntrophomonadaceae bacterium]
MITAMEIRNQQFRKAVRGYSEDEVRNFLVRIAQDYETLYSENAKIRERIQQLEHELTRYHRIEETMNNSLILAQQTAEDLKEAARKEAQLMLEESKRRISDVLMVYQEIIKRMNLFNTELRAQINVQLEMLDKNQHKIEELSDFFYGKDLKEMMERLESINISQGAHDD